MQPEVQDSIFTEAEPDRAELHLRDIAMRGWRRRDGLFDLEGRLTDRKSEPFLVICGNMVPAGEPIHDIRARLTIDIDMHVHACRAWSAATPYSICRDAEQSVQALVGLNISRGWSRSVREHIGSNRGCTHMQEVLLALGTVAFQTLVPFRRELMDARRADGRPVVVDRCVAFAADSPVVAMRWPAQSKQTAG